MHSGIKHADKGLADAEQPQHRYPRLTGCIDKSRRCMYSMAARFVWDAENIMYIARHGVTPQEAERVLTYRRHSHDEHQKPPHSPSPTQ